MVLNNDSPPLLRIYGEYQSKLYGAHKTLSSIQLINLRKNQFLVAM